MYEFEWPENLSIFLDNLCIYHVCFDLISFFTIIFTWWFCKSGNAGHNTLVSSDRVAVQELDSLTNSEEDQEHSKEEENFDLINWTDDSLVSNIKILRQKALVKELQSKLTEDELEEEKKMEKMQLKKIFELLQDQEEKFQMTSMEQLEDQLHLYRV